jgi:hypothetical protein
MIQIYSVIKLHVSGIFSAHIQEFSTVSSALVSFIQVFDDRFQAVRMKLPDSTYSTKLLNMDREDVLNM